VKHLHDRGLGTVWVVNRSLERARSLAERHGDGYAGLDRLPAFIADADLVVSATGAAAAVIHTDTVQGALTGSRSAPLVLLDLAVPRDVDPDVEGLDGVRLIDIRAIRERLMSQGDATTEEIAHAHEIVAEEVRRWVVRRRSDALAPLIRAVRARGEEAVRSELARFAGRLSELTPEERDAVEALARGVAAKLLHDPIVELKERSEPGADDLHAKLLIELLRLDTDTE
jgi:glutamyl-tRNA reductase